MSFSAFWSFLFSNSKKDPKVQQNFANFLMFNPLNYLSEKYYKYRASTLQILIVVALVVNKIVICE